MSIAEKFEVVADAAYEKGRQAQYDEFWDVFQDYGNKCNIMRYKYAYRGFTDANYFPKYPIYTRDAYWMFAESKITDTKVPIILESDTTAAALDGTFRWCINLKTIKELNVDEKTLLTGAFYQCTALENIVITGVVGTNIDFANSSKLTSASVDSIIRALKQLAEGDEARTLTLHKNVKANMTDAQIATIQEKGWTLA